MGLPIFREPSTVEHKEATNPESSTAYRRSIIRRTQNEGRNAQQTYEALLGERARQRQALRQRRPAATSRDTEALIHQEHLRQTHRQPHSQVWIASSNDQEDRANLVLPPITIDIQAITVEPTPPGDRPRSHRGLPGEPLDPTPLPTESDIALFPPLERVDRVRTPEDPSRVPDPPRPRVDGLGDRTRSVTPEVDWGVADEFWATSFQGGQRARDGTTWNTYSLSRARRRDTTAPASLASVAVVPAIRRNPSHRRLRQADVAAATADAALEPHNNNSTATSPPSVARMPNTSTLHDDSPSSPDPLICDDPSPIPGIRDPEEQRHQSMALLHEAETLLERATRQLLRFDTSQVASESYLRGWLSETEGFRVMLERVAGQMRGQEEWLSAELRALRRERERERERL